MNVLSAAKSRKRWSETSKAAVAEWCSFESSSMTFLLNEGLEICDVCRGERIRYRTIKDELVQEADDLVLNAHIEIHPRKKWPSHGEEGGLIEEEQRLETGWCLSAWGSNGWGPLTALEESKLASSTSDDLLEPVAEMIRQRVRSAPEWTAR